MTDFLLVFPLFCTRLTEQSGFDGHYGLKSNLRAARAVDYEFEGQEVFLREQLCHPPLIALAAASVLAMRDALTFDEFFG